MRKRTHALARPLAAAARQEGRIGQSEQAAIFGVHGDAGMQMQAAPGRVAGVAQTGGVLDHQDMPPARLPQRPGARCRDHLLRRHAPIVEKSRQTHLAGAVDPEPANADPAAAARHQPGQQKGPPFCRRRSPNPPRSSLIAETSNRKSPAIDSETRRRGKPLQLQKMCDTVSGGKTRFGGIPEGVSG